MKFSLALPREALSIPVIRRVLGDALRGLGVSDDCIGDILVGTIRRMLCEDVRGGQGEALQPATDRFDGEREPVGRHDRR